MLGESVAIPVIACIVVFTVAYSILSINQKSKAADAMPKHTSAKTAPVKMSVGTSRVDKIKYHTDHHSQKSLDLLYAETHGMWVCPRCETLNDNCARYCIACGASQ